MSPLFKNVYTYIFNHILNESSRGQWHTIKRCLSTTGNSAKDTCICTGHLTHYELGSMVAELFNIIL